MVKLKKLHFELIKQKIKNSVMHANFGHLMLRDRDLVHQKPEKKGSFRVENLLICL